VIRRVHASISVLALVVIGLMLGACLTESSEGASASHHICAAVAGDQISLFKTSSPSVSAVPVERSLPLGKLGQSRYAPPELIENLAPVALWADLSSRSPPA